MSWDEPTVLAQRLARLADAPLVTGTAADAADQHAAAVAEAPDGAVLLLDPAGLARTAADRLAAAHAVVVAGTDPAAGTSTGLVALATQVKRAGGHVALRTFFHGRAADGARVALPLVAATWGDGAALTELLAAGPHSLSLDSTAATAGDEAARVCVVSFELAGMTGGGIGTASTALALSLARSGHEVTLLFTGWQETGAGGDREAWRERYAADGVAVAFLRDPGALVVRTPYYAAGAAYEVYRWLMRHADFDVVHVPENLGHGVYAQLAKRHGSAFAATTFVVGTHGPTRWAAEANRSAIADEELTVRDALERMTVELADVLLGPSVYLHDYLRDRGWTLPERVHVQPYALPDAVRAGRADTTAPAPPAAGRPADTGRALAPADASAALPAELVFFGRLETRKGVVALCDALDLLAARPDDVPAGLNVTFLGPPSSVLGEPAAEYIARRAAAWPWPWRLVTDRDQAQAAAYLQRPGVLAVMPSLVDNAPNTVSETVALGVPLIASRSGGTGELVDAVQRDTYTYGDAAGAAGISPVRFDEPSPPLDPAPLADLLLRRLTEPAADRVRPPADADALDRAYDRWHRAVRATRAATRAAAGAGDAGTPSAPDRETPARSASAADVRPSLAVCVLADGPPWALDTVLDALRPQAQALGATVVVADPRAVGVAAARTAALRPVDADLLVMLRTKEIPLPGLLEALASAAGATGADVYACAVLDDEPLAPEAARSAEDPALQAFVPVFGPPSAGLSHPAFAIGPYAIRRATFDRLGGFAPDAREDEADHELLNRAALSGARIETVPAALAAARTADRWTTYRTTWPHTAAAPPYDAEQWLCAERPFRSGGAGEDVVALLRGVREQTARRLAQEQAGFAERLAELNTWTENLEGTAAQLRQDRADLLEQNAALQAELRELRASASWKVTRPIRAAQQRRRPK